MGEKEKPVVKSIKPMIRGDKRSRKETIISFKYGRVIAIMGMVFRIVVLLSERNPVYNRWVNVNRDIKTHTGITNGQKLTGTSLCPNFVSCQVVSCAFSFFFKIYSLPFKHQILIFIFILNRVWRNQNETASNRLKQEFSSHYSIKKLFWLTHL